MLPREKCYKMQNMILFCSPAALSYSICTFPCIGYSPQDCTHSPFPTEWIGWCTNGPFHYQNVTYLFWNMYHAMWHNSASWWLAITIQKKQQPLIHNWINETHNLEALKRFKVTQCSCKTQAGIKGVWDFFRGGQLPRDCAVIYPLSWG